VVDVEHGSLSSFVQELFAFLHLSVENVRNVANLRNNSRSHCQRIFDHLFDVDRFAVVIVHQQEVDELAVFTNFFCKDFRFCQVSDMDSAASDLVFVGRPDATAGRTDFLIA